MQFNISEEDAKQAKLPHEIFLINLIFNHILVFVALLTSREFAQYVFGVPIASAICIIFLILGAQMVKKSDVNWYVSGHWLLCAKRNFYFLIMISIMGLVFLTLFIVSDGHMRPQHWALGSAVGLPTMATVLVLVIMESEALHHAKVGILPDWIKEKYPQGSLDPIEDKTLQQGESQI
jgi:hypothetical protein